MNNKTRSARIRMRWVLVSITIVLALSLTFVVATTPAPHVSAAKEITADGVHPLPDVTQTGGLMGTCYAFYDSDAEGSELPALAAAAGSRWDRFDFRWNVIEGEDNRLSPLSFGPHDLIVDRDVAHGIQVIGILGSTPKWAAPNCDVSAHTATQRLGQEGTPLFPTSTDDAYWWRPCPPSGLDLDWDAPDNVWGNYVYETVTHFKDRVHVWEIWNEPDLGQIFWSGTPTQYAQLLKVGYQAVKAADPEATVLFAGLAYWSNPSYYISVFDALTTLDGAAENSFYFDALSLHLYSNVYQIRPISTEMQANMASRVGPHPIWLTETGVPLWDEWPDNKPQPAALYHATTAEAASYVVEAFAEARAMGIERFLFFRNHDEAMNEYFGLIRNDLSLRPSYAAFQVAAQYLYGENQITGPFTDEGVRRITFWGTPHGRIDVVWNETAATIAYSHTALLPAATLVDIRGITRTITATEGSLPLILESATATDLLIGGPPLLIIHEDTVTPQSALRTLPNVVYSDALTLTLDVVDEGTGLWYSEIEQARGPAGPWSQIAGWPSTKHITETLVTVPQAGTLYFRSRTRDGAGNWEAWPATAEISTTVILTRTVSISVTAYLDIDNSGVLDAGDLPATGATLTWRYANGTVISSTILSAPALGGAWEVTATVNAGETNVSGNVANYLAAPQTFTVIPAATLQREEIALAFREIRSRNYLPFVMREP